MLVKEYVPDGKREPRTERIETIDQLLAIPWLKGKVGAVEVSDEGTYWFVTTKSGWLLAIVFKE